MESVRTNRFVTSLNLNTHPLLKVKKKTRWSYFVALEYIVSSCAFDTEFTSARLLQYRTTLIGEEKTLTITGDNCDKTVKTIVDDFNNHIVFLCDVALILIDMSVVKKACGMLAKHLSEKKRKSLHDLLEVLYDNKTITSAFMVAEGLIKQFRYNKEYMTKQVLRVMVTANMSAGKSTLINAIIGKPLTRTALEACTANLCYLYNKPYDDNRVHLLASQLNLNATYGDLGGVSPDKIHYIASYFMALTLPQPRICLIDTPGVDSAINKSHGKLTRDAIISENYNKLVYVLNASNLGTDAEIKHMKFVYENVPCDKVVFVLNKLDCFKNSEDSIASSIESVKGDLQKIGFENPILCPLSAYFSLLLKMKQNNIELGEDDQDVYDGYKKKFNKPEYDLSAHYDKSHSREAISENEMAKMCSISGLYGLERILYGGTAK